MIHPDYTAELTKFKSLKKISLAVDNNLFEMETSQRKLSIDSEFPNSSSPILRNTRERNMALKEIEKQQIQKELDLKLSIRCSNSLLMDTSTTSVSSISESSLSISIECDTVELQSEINIIAVNKDGISPSMEQDFSMMSVRSPTASGKSPSAKKAAEEPTIEKSTSADEAIEEKLSLEKLTADELFINELHDDNLISDIVNTTEELLDDEIITTIENIGENLSPFTIYSRRSLFYRDLKGALTSTPL